MKFISNRRVQTALIAVCAALILLSPLLSYRAFAPAPALAIGEPPPGTVVRAVSYTFYPATVGTAGTAYSDAPNTTTGGIDISRVSEWNSVDIFVTADISGTATLTVTPQFSADQSNWTDADYTYPALTQSTSQTITNTGIITSVQLINTSISTALTTQTHYTVQTADGVDYMRVPVAGEYMRLKLQRSGTITATVLATVRNN